MGVEKPDNKRIKLVREEMLEADSKLLQIVEKSNVHKNNVKTIYSRLRMENTGELLAGIPVEELNRDKSGIRVASLRAAGYENIGQLVGVNAMKLKTINGISEEAGRVIATRVYEIHKAMSEGVAVKITADDKNVNTMTLINSLGILKEASSDITRANKLVNDCHFKVADGAEKSKIITNPIKWLFLTDEKKQAAMASYNYIDDLYSKGFAKETEGLYKNYESISYQSTKENTWADFLNDPASYFAYLEKIIDRPVVENQVVPGMPDQLAREIDAFELDTSLMKATLRSYQEFGSKYALHQKRVLLGDEMGLGKTMQAIGMMAHLAATGKTHFIVVCPVSVMVNWHREILKHSGLQSMMVYGSDRGDEFNEWQQNGGVAVTTYETISRLELSDELRYDSLVVDEAHYVKNPEAIRTKALARFAEKSEYVMFMTGTPIENKVDEMIFIISMLNQGISQEIKKLTSMTMAPVFRETIAPVYLRRVREDVLTELPGKEEIEEWCQMSAADMETYKQSLMAENFMQVRQVSWNTPNIAQSSKANRLKEICDEAAQEGRKVIVFSFFLDTIKKVQEVMGDRCYGPIDGSISAEKRQELVDEFSEGPAGSVLVSQIIAGGVGLNIQSASVVIICEPQWKPSTENQAISRAYRMGQARNVLVYRLLADETVDEEILNILKDKTEIFNNFADESAIDEANKVINEGKAMASIVQNQMIKYGLKSADTEEAAAKGQETSVDVEEAPTKVKETSVDIEEAPIDAKEIGEQETETLPASTEETAKTTGATVETAEKMLDNTEYQRIDDISVKEEDVDFHNQEDTTIRDEAVKEITPSEVQNQQVQQVSNQQMQNYQVQQQMPNQQMQNYQVQQQMPNQQMQNYQVQQQVPNQQMNSNVPGSSPLRQAGMPGSSPLRQGGMPGSLPLSNKPLR